MVRGNRVVTHGYVSSGNPNGISHTVTLARSNRSSSQAKVFPGGCNCESGLPIRHGPDHETNNADIAALAAPHPQLLISVTWRGEGNERRKDQSCNTPEVELPYLRRVYRLLGAEDNVANLHLPDQGHDYGFNKRVGAYSFCAEHLNLELASIQDRSGQVDESFVCVLDEHDLRVWDADHPPPDGPLSGAALLNLPPPG